MPWQDKPSRDTYLVPDDIQDLSFRIRARCLPLDHAHALSSAVIGALPWIEHESLAGIHLIHVAESGNGWYRPEDPETELLQVSRRTRMRLRLPKRRLDDARCLTGKTLDLNGYEIAVGEAAAKPLSALTTIHARYVIAERDQAEEEFIEKQVKDLQALGVHVHKLLCGKRTCFKMPDGLTFARSLMLADLDVDESIVLQQRGLGPGRKFGCGLFLPHKGIRPVKIDDQ